MVKLFIILNLQYSRLAGGACSARPDLLAGFREALHGMRKTEKGRDETGWRQGGEGTGKEGKLFAGPMQICFLRACVATV